MEIHIARRSGDDRPSPAYHVDGLPRQLTQLQLEDAVVEAFATIEQLQSDLDAERLWIKEGKKLHQVQQAEISQLRRELASVTADRDERAVQKGDLLRHTQEQQVIPFVLRATGRTIPDLTGREHVCEWQSAVRPWLSSERPASCHPEGEKS
jgi:hypothetical protein